MTEQPNEHVVSDHDLPEGHDGHCLHCKKDNTGAMNTQGEDAPQVESLILCFYCGYLMQFGTNAFTHLPEGMIEDVLADPNACRILWVRAVMAAKGLVPTGPGEEETSE